MRLLLPVAAVLVVNVVNVGCSKSESAPARVDTAERARQPPAAWVHVGANDPVDDQLQATLARAKKNKQPVFVDYWADWCAPCKEMDKTVFQEPQVKEALGRFVKVKIDTTADTEAIRAAQKRYSVTSMPTFLFFGPDGALLDDLRVSEKVDAGALIARLEKVPAG
jgi:thiol:disulfide interchange protein DsbD